MLGLVFLERLRACARLPRPPGSARAGRRVTGEEIMQELRETTSRLVNIATGGCSYSFVNWEMLSVRPNRGMLTPSH